MATSQLTTTKVIEYKVDQVEHQRFDVVKHIEGQEYTLTVYSVEDLVESLTPKTGFEQK